MKITEGYLKLKQSIADQFIVAGWSTVDDTGMNCTAAVATRLVDTAVGKKEIRAYLITANPQPGGVTAVLTGEYESEGRNALSTTWFNLVDKMNKKEIESGVDAFCKEVNAVVDKTYARRLLLLES